MYSELSLALIVPVKVLTLENKKIKNDRSEHFSNQYKNLEQNKDTKGTYNLLKYQAGWKTGGPPVRFNMDGRSITAPQMIAEVQIDYFQEKVNKLQRELPNNCEDPLEILTRAINRWERATNRPEFRLRQVTELEVLAALKELGNSSSSGLDTIDSTSLKALATYTYKPITYLVNLSIKNNEFAARWKLAKVIPIHKGKDKPTDHPSSFRPISLLSATSKIVERIIHKQLLKYMMETKQLNMNQHSYKPNHSTTSALCQLMDTLYSATDQNLISVLLSVDQSGAFDNVSHQILLKKLTMYNCSNESLKWFRNYLNFRSQCVSIGSKLSKITLVNNGVPQGSILGPLLYIIYTNEMPNILKERENCQHNNTDPEYLFGMNCLTCGMLVCYADDATMVSASNSRTVNQNKLETSLNYIDSFLTSNKLSINRTKTTIAEIMIGQKRAKTPGATTYTN